MTAHKGRKQGEEMEKLSDGRQGCWGTYACIHMDAYGQVWQVYDEI